MTVTQSSEVQKVTAGWLVPDDLYQRIKLAAAEDRVTASQMVAEGMERILAERTKRKKKEEERKRVESLAASESN
jgi:hypothetical protein